MEWLLREGGREKREEREEREGREKREEREGERGGDEGGNWDQLSEDASCLGQ